MRYTFLLLLVVAPLPGKDSCLDCHSQMAGDLQKPALEFRNSVHLQEQFTCANCHGGDAGSDDPLVAMSPAHGFIGVPARTAIPKLCARCHSDPDFMRKYNPSERVDQYAEYVTSVHGQRLAQGDTRVATCVDCHRAHDILFVRDPNAPVYPLNVPKTCAHCHADAAHMAPYKIPTDQYANYMKSVHWEELSKRDDLSAPTCATCHGNHGAKPPAVSSVAAVCGTCHVFEAQLFDKSPHAAAFSSLPTGACVVCHSNHAVFRATDRLLAGRNAVCSQCHTADSPGGKAAAEMASLIGTLQQKIEAANAILQEAQNSGVEVSAAIAQQTDARQSLVKSRANVHAFAVAEVAQPVQAGMVIAVQDYQTGERALRERQVRRIGLVISMGTILLTMAGLWLTLRWIHGRRS
jgi:predicted CXXCH cytochrome family protein